MTNNTPTLETLTQQNSIMLEFLNREAALEQCPHTLCSIHESVDEEARAQRAKAVLEKVQAVR